MARDLRQSVEVVQDRRSFVANMGVQPFELEVFQEIEGAGEARVGISFPIWFVEKPLIVPGILELAPGSLLEDGNFPFVGGASETWTMVERDVYTYYTGVTLGLVVFGPSTQTGWVHLSVKGRGLRNPIALEE